jgi:hypothetical protein
MTSYPDTGEYETDEPAPEKPCKPEKPPCRPCAPDPDDCGSESIANVRCQAVGIEAQAEFNKEYQPPLDAAQETYASARSSYRETRATVACDVRDLKHEISCLIERIRCLIKQEHVVVCLDDAFDCVVCSLEKCDKPKDPLDCNFDTDCGDLALEAITHRIVEYTAKLAAAKDRFSWLVGEPDRLKQRVDTAKAEVKAVQDALKADPAVTDPKKLYVQAIVAWYHLKYVWGYYLTVSKFIDALCEALTCWRNAVVAVSKLVRYEAEVKCHRDAKDKECERLRLQTVDEILVIYERLCGQSQYDDDDDSGNKYGKGGGGKGDSDVDDEGGGYDRDEKNPPGEDEPYPHGEDSGRYGKGEKYRGGEGGRYGYDPDDETGYRRRRPGAAE